MMTEKIKMFLKDEEGSNVAEYALLLALIAVAVIVGAGALGTNTNTKIQAVATKIDGIAGP